VKRRFKEMEAILVKVTFNPADGTVNRTEERTWYEFAAAELLKKLGEHWEDRITISDNDIASGVYQEDGKLISIEVIPYGPKDDDDDEEEEDNELD
jgi:hypothetical protein